MSVERLEEGNNAACVCCSGEECLCVSLKAIMRDLFLDDFIGHRHGRLQSMNSQNVSLQQLGSCG